MQIVSQQIMPYFRDHEVRGRIIRLHAFFLRYFHLLLLLPSKRFVLLRVLDKDAERK